MQKVNVLLTDNLPQNPGERKRFFNRILENKIRALLEAVTSDINTSLWSKRPQICVPYEKKYFWPGGGESALERIKMAAVEDRTNSNPLVQPLLTDLYQITMAYAYWKSGKVMDSAVFDLYFRRNPFHGEFTVFAGLEECVHFVRNFKFSDSGTKIIVF